MKAEKILCRWFPRILNPPQSTKHHRTRSITACDQSSSHMLYLSRHILSSSSFLRCHNEMNLQIKYIVSSLSQPSPDSVHAETRCIKAPARGAISFTSEKVSVLYNDTTNAFLNAPSKQLDHAWSTLLQSKCLKQSDPMPTKHERLMKQI
jgi:hypothetical protein